MLPLQHISQTACNGRRTGGIHWGDRISSVFACPWLQRMREEGAAVWRNRGRAPLLGAAFFVGPSKGVLWERPAKEPRCHSHKAAEAGRCAPWERCVPALRAMRGGLLFQIGMGTQKSMENEKAIPGGRTNASGHCEVRGTWRFSVDHPLFDDHFPGAPRVPGTLVIEAMRAGAEALFPGWRVAGVKRFRFRHFIEPGEYGYAFIPQPDASAIRCVLLSGDRRMAEGTLLLAEAAAREEA